MAGKTLSLTLRPRTFKTMFGQRHITDAIRKQARIDRLPTSWLFAGPAGTGKTTLARIVAVSLQCTHKSFGYPCADCYANREQFTINEQPAAGLKSRDASGVDAIRDLVQQSSYAPNPQSAYRVIILDEVQRITVLAQDILLKYCEDYSPDTTVWILTTTNPDKISKALRRRCLSFVTRPLRDAAAEEFVRYAARKGGITRDLDDFIAFIHENDVNSPGVMLMALEKYAAGLDPDVAMLSESEVNTLSICQRLVAGDWPPIKREMLKCTPDEVKAVRGAILGYLRSILLGQKTGGAMASKAAKAIVDISKTSYEENILLSELCAVLFEVAKRFP